MSKLGCWLKRFGALALSVTALQAWGGYETHPDADKLIAELTPEGFEESYIRSVLATAERKQSILDAISRPAERRLNWGEYRAIFIEPKRIAQALEFWSEHRDTLARAEAEFGVPAEIILAIMGVETRFGRIMGNFRVLDALSTLGFDYPRRADFFRGQLADYFRLIRQENIEPGTLKGSYAGAMGYGQFIPSSYLAYAIDFDGDGKTDIWSNKTDAIGSVANYFAKHGWQPGQPVRSNVVLNEHPDDSWINQDLKPELTLAQWHERGVDTHKGLDPESKATLMRMETDDGAHFLLGLHNFYVITRYNHSRLYANAVYELSQLIVEEMAKQSGS